MILACSYRLDDLDLYPRLELPAQRFLPVAIGSTILIFIITWSYRFSDPRLELPARRSCSLFSLGATGSAIFAWRYQLGDLNIYFRLELPSAIVAWSFRLGDLALYTCLKLPAQRFSPVAMGSVILIFILA